MSAFKQMAGSSQFFVSISRIAHRDSLYHFPNLYLMDLQKSMLVVGHPVERVDACVILLDRLGNDRIQCQLIVDIRENVLAVIAPQDHVIETTRNVKSR